MEGINNNAKFMNQIRSYIPVHVESDERDVSCSLNAGQTR